MSPDEYKKLTGEQKADYIAAYMKTWTEKYKKENPRAYPCDLEKFGAPVLQAEYNRLKNN